MTGSDWRDLLVAFGVAATGAVLFYAISFPAAPLTGSAVAITIAGLAGLKVSMPVWLRNGAFVLLGINIGTGVTPETLTSAVRWPLSIIILLLCLFASMAITKAVLVRRHGFDAKSAVLASAPGHLSFVLTLSLDNDADTARIAIVQSIRVLFITLIVPLFVVLWFGPSGIDVLPETVMTPVAVGIAVALTLLAGFAFSRLRLPAAFLLAGMLVSATLHGLELTPGRLPDPLTVAAFLIMGMLIGSRFSGQKLSDVREAAAAGASATAINMVVALLGVVIVFLALGLPPATLVVAFAPGGVEAMAAIALSLGLDPAFVAAHHFARLIILTFLIPLMLRKVRS